MHPVKAAAYGTPIAGATVTIGPRLFNGGDAGQARRWRTRFVLVASNQTDGPPGAAAPSEVVGREPAVQS
jgi:hypothetical protein